MRRCATTNSRSIRTSDGRSAVRAASSCLGLMHPSSTPREARQQNLRRQLIHGAGALGDADAARFEHALRLDGGQPLIPVAQWDAGAGRQTLARIRACIRLGGPRGRSCAAGSPSTAGRLRAPRSGRASAARSSRILVRCSVGRPCAVIPKGSLSASPMRRLPRSSARMRRFARICLEIHACPIIVIGK